MHLGVLGDERIVWWSWIDFFYYFAGRKIQSNVCANNDHGKNGCVNNGNGNDCDRL